MSNNITALDIEIAISQIFDRRKNIMICNVQKGADLHECDVLMLRPTGYATEFEIKITKSDLAKDKKKEHAHTSDKINELYYAVPMSLVHDVMRVARPHVGIVGVKRTGALDFQAEVIRQAVPNGGLKWTDAEKLNLTRLDYLRTWNLKEQLRECKNKLPRK